MSFLQKAREAAEQMANQARQTGEQARQPGEQPPAPAGWLQPTATAQSPVGWGPAADAGPAKSAAEQAREALGFAKKGLVGMVDKLDPGTMADLIIKATALQEKANLALRDKGSPYRISEISITASLPPAVSFVIGRMDDPGEVVSRGSVSSSRLMAEAGEEVALPMTAPETPPG